MIRRVAQHPASVRGSGAKAPLAHQPEGGGLSLSKSLPCIEQAALALRRFGVRENDWGSEKPVEAAKQFAAEFRSALHKHSA